MRQTKTKVMRGGDADEEDDDDDGSDNDEQIASPLRSNVSWLSNEVFDEP